ncbi:MAG: ribosome maturation factor RimP [Acidimicrobiales bacterium]
MDVADRLLDALSPVMASFDLELVDVTVDRSHLQVVVDRPGGVDLESLAEASRQTSRVLEQFDDLSSEYGLEVTSPGLERPLKTRPQFARAVGETVSVRVTSPEAPTRRVRGRLVAADESGITIDCQDDCQARDTLRVPYELVDRARTVFEWGPPRTPSPKGGRKRERSKR